MEIPTQLKTNTWRYQQRHQQVDQEVISKIDHQIDQEVILPATGRPSRFVGKQLSRE